MSQDTQLVRLFCLGRFRVVLDNGADVTPSRKKACALLGILAMTPKFERSRIQLQDLLWSNFAEPQARSNLGGEVHLIKKCLGHASGVLQSADGMLRLDRRRVWIDLLDAQDDASAEEAARRPEMLLENITLRDPEFDDWIRDQRQRLPDVLTRECPVPQSAVPQERLQRPAANLTLLPPRSSFGEGSGFAADTLVQMIGRGVFERTGIVVREAAEPGDGISLRVEVATDPVSSMIHVVIAAEGESRLIWTKSEPAQGSVPTILAAEHVRRLVNQCIDVCILELCKFEAFAAGRAPVALALEHIHGMLTLDMSELPDAQRRLEDAYEVDRKPVLLGYMAYLRAFQIAELRPDNADDLRAEAAEIAARAVEQDPSNATLLALMSCVQSVVLRNHVYGHELGEQSLRLDPSNPLAMVFLGRAKAYLGQVEAGHSLAEKALRISGVGMARHGVSIFAAATALLIGRNGDAIRLCEVVRAACPSYKAPLRMLIPLYAKCGRRDDARKAYHELKGRESGFSLEQP